MPQQSPLTMATIAAKLAATEREADAARVRAKLKAARMGRSKPMAPPALPASVISSRKETRDVEPTEEESEKILEGEITTRKRKAGRTQGGRANRRRSTLSPWEMESLILGGMGSPSKVD